MGTRKTASPPKSTSSRAIARRHDVSAGAGATAECAAGSYFNCAMRRRGRGPAGARGADVSGRKGTSKAQTSTGQVVAQPDAAEPVESSFAEVVDLIEQARRRAYQAVDSELVGLYWRIGQYISAKLAAAVWGEGVVDRLAQHLARRMPGQRGFTRRNLFRMRQFFEAYSTDEKVTPLVTQLPWTHNLIILTQSKRPEERDFYLRMAVQQRWGKRELERQYRLGAFERAVLSQAKVSPALTQMHGAAAVGVFKDTYSVEFLSLPNDHTEADLHSGLLGQLRAFLIELGRDFCFVASQFPLQVGGRDFALDLLFFHRGLNCLVAFELKVDRFEPEHLGKLNFYLEALDRDVRKTHENPAIGVLLCASKETEVVEYALSRTLSPALVAQYQTQLPDKQMLAAKLHEFYALNAPAVEAENALAINAPAKRKSKRRLA
jgi:predicted nuclease of restriction endonuclease-like (RecB) superfamily